MVLADTSLEARLELLYEAGVNLDAGWAEEASNSARRGTNIVERTAI